MQNQEPCANPGAYSISVKISPYSTYVWGWTYRVDLPAPALYVTASFKQLDVTNAFTLTVLE